LLKIVTKRLRLENFASRSEEIDHRAEMFKRAMIFKTKETPTLVKNDAAYQTLYNRFPLTDTIFLPWDTLHFSRRTGDIFFQSNGEVKLGQTLRLTL
jgi:hypothetical protein